MYYLILDTETTNSIEEPLAYDIGFSVIDETGKTYESFSFVVAEIFCDKELMENAYFSEKISMYWEDIKNGKRNLAKLSTIVFTIRYLMEKYHIYSVIAHNCRFDYLSTNLTQRYITKSKYRYFFKYGTEFIDTLKMARQVFGKDKEYIEFCEQNGYKTARGQLRFTAEILYRFLSGNNEFVESHTGFEDTEIEKEIFAECMRRNPEIDGKLW